MELYFEDEHASFYLGDARNLDVPDESVDLIFTSPPYYGKRWYGEEVITVSGGDPECSHVWGDELPPHHPGQVEQTKWKNAEAAGKGQTAPSGQYCSLCGCWRGSLGLEPTWQLYIEHLCECAREWWKKLKPTGSLVINIGDTFATHTSKRSAQFGGDIEDEANLIFTQARPPQNYPEKMKLGIPWRLRFALNDMGWVSRGDWVWYKGKEYPDGTISKVAMPESVKDRMSASYEMVFHFVKSRGNRCERYFYDLDAIRQPHRDSGRIALPSSRGQTDWAANAPLNQPQMSSGPNGVGQYPAGANPGDVWIIQPEPFKLKHYAVWPSELCERVIKVACPKEVCPKCGKPRERITNRESIELRPKSGSIRGHSPSSRVYLGQAQRGCRSVTIDTIGWSDCGCGEGFVPGVILDPFCGGSGRAARMARKLGRRFIGVDLKSTYLEMSRECYLQGETKEIQEQQELGAKQGVLL